MVRFNLKDKVAVITGAAHGIGLAITEEFLKRGVKTVILIDLNENVSAIADNLNSKYGANKAVCYKCDVTKDLETVSKNIFGSYKSIDVLVNNAGIMNESLIRQTIEINALSVIEWSMKFLERMKQNGGGTIINVASGYVFTIDHFIPIYKASKHAVYGFSRSIGDIKNYEKSKVRFLVLCPGMTNTGFCNTFVGEEFQADWDLFVKDNIDSQNPESVGRATAEIFEIAESGTAWIINKGIIEQVP